MRGRLKEGDGCTNAKTINSAGSQSINYAARASTVRVLSCSAREAAVCSRISAEPSDTRGQTKEDMQIR